MVYPKLSISTYPLRISGNNLTGRSVSEYGRICRNFFGKFCNLFHGRSAYFGVSLRLPGFSGCRIENASGIGKVVTAHSPNPLTERLVMENVHQELHRLFKKVVLIQHHIEAFPGYGYKV